MKGRKISSTPCSTDTCAVTLARGLNALPAPSRIDWAFFFTRTVRTRACPIPSDRDVLTLLSGAHVREANPCRCDGAAPAGDGVAESSTACLARSTSPSASVGRRSQAAAQRAWPPRQEYFDHAVLRNSGLRNTFTFKRHLGIRGTALALSKAHDVLRREHWAGAGEQPKFRLRWSGRGGPPLAAPEQARRRLSPRFGATVRIHCNDGRVIGTIGVPPQVRSMS